MKNLITPQEATLPAAPGTLGGRGKPGCFAFAMRLSGGLILGLWLGLSAAPGAAPPRITEVVLVPQLTIESPTGITNQVQFTPALGSGDWRVVTNIFVTQTPYHYVDKDAAAAPAGFYRVMVPSANPPVEVARRHLRVTVVSQLWSDAGRTLAAVVEKINQAVAEGTDLIALPMECVKTDGESIPGPISLALADEAMRHRVYIIGNLRERSGGRTYVTSFLCDRTGAITGKYRKSHKLPDETMDLGNDLPVFRTEFGTVAMRIGSDRYFADIDHVFTTKGAGLIFWAQQPEPVEDEYAQDFPSAGRAFDYRVNIVCSRYASASGEYITTYFPPFVGMPIGRSYVINREGQRVASTPRVGAGLATATLPLSFLRPGRYAYDNVAFAPLTAPVTPLAKRTWAKRKVRVTTTGAYPSFDSLLAALDEAGRLGSDIVSTFEYGWITGTPPEEIAGKTAIAKARNAQVAAKAREWNMYIILTGIVDRLERNEAIIYGRDGREVGRFFKLSKTHPEMIPGTSAPVFETDFGRIAVRICADEEFSELDRSYGVQGADILFTPTQSWGPDALSRNLRDISRAMDAGFFLVEATSQTSEQQHRSIIVDPTGAIVASSQYSKRNLVSALLDLNSDRPLRFTRTYTPHQPTGYLPQFQPAQLPTPTNDLRTVVLRQRRPELYGVLKPTGKPGP